MERLRLAEFVFGDFRLVRRSDHRCLYRRNNTSGGEPIDLPADSRAFDLLCLLAQRRSPRSEQKREVVSSKEIFAIVWAGSDVRPSNLYVQI